MSYTLPVFNTDCGVTIDVGAPDDGLNWTTNYPSQLYTGPKFRHYNTPIGTQWYTHVSQFRFKPDIFYADFDPLAIMDWAITFLQFPNGQGVFYRAINWQIANYGFSNEYPFVTAVLCRGEDGMPVFPGTANLNGFPGGWPYNMGPVP